MKGFLKFLGGITVFITGIIGALSIYDHLKNKNCIKSSYMDCSCDEEIED